MERNLGSRVKWSIFVFESLQSNSISWQMMFDLTMSFGFSENNALFLSNMSIIGLRWRSSWNWFNSNIAINLSLGTSIFSGPVISPSMPRIHTQSFLNPLANTGGVQNLGTSSRSRIVCSGQGYVLVLIGYKAVKWLCWGLFVCHSASWISVFSFFGSSEVSFEGLMW